MTCYVHAVADSRLADTDTPIDGRRARRERGRLAVTEAMLDLVLEGSGPPAAEQVAARAGVSSASLFRYFETLDDLRSATTRLYFERFRDLFEVPDIGSGPLDVRIAALVRARVELYEQVEPIARLARWRAVEVRQLDETVHRVRATFADQIRHQFDAELRSMSPARRDDAVTVIATLTSFESWDQARHDHGRSPSQLRRGWTDALTRLLTA